MDKFIEDLGFRVAEHPVVAVAIAAVAGLAGLLLAIQAVRHRGDVQEYRVLAVVLGVFLLAGSVLGPTYAHDRAGDACQRWGRSADNVDVLRFLSHECEERF